MQVKNYHYTKETKGKTPLWIKLAKLCLLLSVLTLLLSSCGTKKYLKTGESFVKANKVVVKLKKKKEKKKLEGELPALVKQQPNDKFFFLFQLGRWAWYRANRIPKKEKKGKRRFNSWVKRKVAQPPAIYDSLLTQESISSLTFYLQNQGYNEARVEANVKTKRKQTTVTYTAFPGPLYTIDTVIYTSKDEKLERILRDISSESELKPGDPVREALFNAEATRINRRLQNMGYASFSTNYIQPLGDTTDYKTTIYYEVLTPLDEAEHTAFSIGEVTINPVFFQEDRLAPHLDTVIGGYDFYILQSAKDNIVDPETILRAIHLRPGELYMIDKAERTLQQLQNMDYFRNISIRRQIDSLQPDRLNFSINLTPAKRMQFEARVEVNNSNFNPGIIQGPLVGFSGLIGYKHRNFFKNATNFTTDVSGGFELDLGQGNDLFYSSEIQSRSNFTIPKFIDLNGFWSLLNKTKAINDDFHQRVKASAKTQISLNYNYYDIFQFYSYHSFDATFGYQFPLGEGSRLRVNTVGVNYLLPNFDPAFDTVLMENVFLEKSFSEQLFTGFLFRNFSYEKRTKVDANGGSWFFRGDVEVSGLEILFANQIKNSLENSNTPLTIGNIPFAHYFRTELDLRRFQTLASNQSLALRLNAGVALPYGQFSDEVPFTRQFYVGGPYSIRGWRIRELGPGTYKDPMPNTRVPFFQVADFKLEFNVEYRFDIFPPFYMEGAIFLDGGNIWTFRAEDGRPGAKLTQQFYEQIALGTGFGLRFDFNYFILRFDGGIKLRDPSELGDIGSGNPWIFNEWLDRPFKQLNYNIAVGMPF